MSAKPSLSRRTIRHIQSLRDRGEPIAMLTAYDYVTASLLDKSDLDMILVGDSLGNVVLGHPTTLPVTLEDMIRHAAAVHRGTTRALIVCDLPFGTATDPDSALRNAITILQRTGCEAVKIEGGAVAAPTITRLVNQGIPVMAHIGLMPQAVHQMGGYYQHGKTAEGADRLLETALALQDAGAFAIVLECIVPDLAARITSALSIPTIGIGSGVGCSGQVLVVNDLIGLSIERPPGFVAPRADVAAVILDAVSAYVTSVKSGEES